MSDSINEESTNKRDIRGKIPEILFCVVWAALILWRLAVLYLYCADYTDDDQALMWYGTVHFAHRNFPEPCFFGQNYGSMLESLLAVPFYLMGWPLNYALPLTTGLLYIIPFAFCSIWLLKKDRRIPALVLLLIPACVGWQCDVMTSVPRALISGFPFAVIGTVILCDRESRLPAQVIGALLMAVGCMQVMTAYAVIMIAALCLIFDLKKNIVKLAILGSSVVVSVIGTAAVKHFYVVNPEYHLHPDPETTFGAGFFMENLNNLPDLLKDFCAVEGAGVVLIPLCLIISVIILIKQKKYKLLAATVCTAVGCLAFLFLKKSTDHLNGSLLYGQSRLFLFVPFVLATLYTITQNDEVSEKDHSFTQRNTALAVAAVCLCGLIFKAFAFSNAMGDDDSALYNDSATDKTALVVGVMPVDELKEQSELVNAVALQYGVKAVSLRNGVIADADTGAVRLPYKSIAYVCSALYYDSPYEFFLPAFERRTWVYTDMAYDTGGRMLLLKYPVVDPNDMMLVELADDESPAAWFIINHGIHRNFLDYAVGEF